MGVHLMELVGVFALRDCQLQRVKVRSLHIENEINILLIYYNQSIIKLFSKEIRTKNFLVHEIYWICVERTFITSRPFKKNAISSIFIKEIDTDGKILVINAPANNMMYFNDLLIPLSLEKIKSTCSSLKLINRAAHRWPFNNLCFLFYWGQGEIG